MLLQPPFHLFRLHPLPSHHHSPIYSAAIFNSPITPSYSSISCPIQPPSLFSAFLVRHIVPRCPSSSPLVPHPYSCSAYIQLPYHSFRRRLHPLIQQIHSSTSRHFLHSHSHSHSHSPSTFHHPLQSPHHLPSSHLTASITHVHSLQ